MTWMEGWRREVGGEGGRPVQAVRGREEGDMSKEKGGGSREEGWKRRRRRRMLTVRLTARLTARLGG